MSNEQNSRITCRQIPQGDIVAGTLLGEVSEISSFAKELTW